MKTALLPFVCLVFTVAPVAAAFDDPAPQQPSAFRVASVVPADATMLVTIENAAAIRAELEDRPIARWMNAALLSGEAGQTWAGLARHAGMTETQLFDLCFGRRTTLITRTSAPDSDWALMTEIDAATSTRLLRTLRATSLGPRFGGSAYEVPEHDLLLVQRNDTMMVGPRPKASTKQRVGAPSSLLHDVASRLDARAAMPSLADAPAMTAARTLPEGNIAVYMKHDRPLGGWSVAVANLVGEHVTVRQFARFESAPFTRDLTELEIDLAALHAFEDHALVAIIEPTDTGRSQFETFTLSAIGEGIVSPAMRRNMADRRLFIVSEVEGRDEPEPFDLQAPTLSVCIELRDPAIAEEQLDRQMTALARRINQSGQGRFCLTIPEELAFMPDAPRAIDLSPAGQWLTGGLPLAKPLSLSWRIARSESASWYVISSHPKQLDDTVRVLASVRMPRPDGPPNNPAAQRLHHGGIANGARISHHLRSWSDRADLLAMPDDTNELREMILLLSEFAAGVDRCRWRIARPARQEMCLEIELTLSAPESTRTTPK